MNRWLLKTVLGVFLMAVTALPLFAQPKVEVVPQRSAMSQTVGAIGEATAQIRPDIAILTFSVEIRNANTTEAVLVNQRMTKKIVGQIEKAGTAPDSIAVGNYRMEYVVNTFIPALGTNQPIEFRVEQHGTYRVTTDIVVTVHDISSVAKLLNTALVAGVDRIGRVQYDSSRLAEVETQLVPQAIKKARQKAETLAHDAGLQLGEPLSVTELPNGPEAVKTFDGSPGPGQTAPPLIEVVQRVRVVYAATKAGG